MRVSRALERPRPRRTAFFLVPAHRTHSHAPCIGAWRARRNKNGGNPFFFTAPPQIRTSAVPCKSAIAADRPSLPPVGVRRGMAGRAGGGAPRGLEDGGKKEKTQVKDDAFFGSAPHSATFVSLLFGSLFSVPPSSRYVRACRVCAPPPNQGQSRAPSVARGKPTARSLRAGRRRAVVGRRLAALPGCSPAVHTACAHDCCSVVEPPIGRWERRLGRSPRRRRRHEPPGASISGGYGPPPAARAAHSRAAASPVPGRAHSCVL